MPQEETSRNVDTTPLKNERQPTAPIWARVPRGWVIVVLFLIGWLGVFLIWNGIRFVLSL